MKTWNQLFVRHGWLLEEKKENVFNCEMETVENMQFLLDRLRKARVDFVFKKDFLTINSPSIDEQQWIEVLDFKKRGRTENVGLAIDAFGPPVRKMDTFISGLVRQLNRLGFHTISSCDGHGSRRAHLHLSKDSDKDKLIDLLLNVFNQGIHVVESKLGYRLDFTVERTKLLDLAERLSVINKKWLGSDLRYLKKHLFYHTLEEVLSIPGSSGHEQHIRQFVKEKLTPYVDHIMTDRYGNLLAEKTYKTGNGPTILLNAHLDVVYELEPDREIIKELGRWRSSKGILGADDRAGVAVILQMAKNLLNSDFSGKVKYIFTVEEETGLVGARHVDEHFLWDVDAAFVLDRRGIGDIVTSYADMIPFCDVRFGKFIEHIAKESGHANWKCTSGGSSDTRIWAEHGIQSVNLSVGYFNEHTDEEYLNAFVCFSVTELLEAIFAKSRELRRLVRRIRRSQHISSYTNERRHA